LVGVAGLVDVGTVVEQHFDGFEPADLHREGEGCCSARAAAAISWVPAVGRYGRGLLHQEAQHWHVLFENGEEDHRRGLAVSAANDRVVVDEKLHHVQVAVTHGVEERGAVFCIETVDVGAFFEQALCPVVCPFATRLAEL